MKPDDILALLHIKPEDMPEIATITTNKPTWASIKAFQEIMQDQSMAITTFDQNLGFLWMALRASYFNPINNGNPFAPPTDPVPAHINAIGTASQITKFVRLYKYYKDKFTTYCQFRIF